MLVESRQVRPASLDQRSCPAGRRGRRSAARVALLQPPQTSGPPRRISERPPRQAAAARARFLPEALIAALLAGGQDSEPTP